MTILLTGNVTQAGEKNVDEEVGAAAALKEDTQRLRLVLDSDENAPSAPSTYREDDRWPLAIIVIECEDSTHQR